VHHRTIQINHQHDAKIFQFIILTFVYSSTCFGRFPAHHQELNNCSGNLLFYLRNVVIVVLCSWSGWIIIIYFFRGLLFQIHCVPFKQARLLSDVFIHYARTALCTKKWMAFASSCITAHLGWCGPVQSQLHTNVLPLLYPLSPYI
jgi:hypothetical protein